MRIPIWLVLLAPVFAAQEDEEVARWPSFRGERARGVVEGHATPKLWNVPSGRNVAWRTPIPGLAHSSPVIWGDRLFVTTAMKDEGEAELSSLYGSPGYGAGKSVEDEGAHAFKLYCLDKQTGAILWERTAHTGVPQVKRHPKSSHANPTPACDAERVVAFFGSEGLYCYDHEGELLWKRDFGVLDVGAPRMPDPEPYQWGFASSPVLHDGRVIVQCDVQGQSFLTVLDAENGKEIWRVDRDEDPSWCTPTVLDAGADGKPQIICNGYKHIGGYDLDTGREVWKLVGGGDVPVPTPVVADDLIFITSAHGPMRPIHAIRTTAKGTLSMNAAEDEHMEWNHKRRGIYMQTPLCYDGLLYLCSDGGVLGCYDALSGREVYRERLGSGKSGFSGSGVAADGKLYFSGESGEIFVIRAGPEFELLAIN
ncbi:MAG: PQQ-binding-like beta-propeller repeat protein, partial [Planctomycetota bacterium]|nr:PQQ-binding-like beta-propeller repeat protein [Planctomycetota bacterium]